MAESERVGVCEREKDREREQGNSEEKCEKMSRKVYEERESAWMTSW
jgi:hypothetical protein